MDRRDFMKMMGLASSATLASSCGADKGTQKLIPYLVPPEKEIIPGQALYYRTTCTECPANCGMMVRVRDGNAIKLEGIPEHPISHGALCVRGQASLYRLYHPDRIRSPLIKGADGKFSPTTWDNAFAQINEFLVSTISEGLDNLFLSARTTGTLSKLIDQFCNKLGIERLSEFEIYSHSNLRRANEILFNKNEIPCYRIDNSDFLLTLGSDILETFSSPVSHAVQLARTKEQPNFKWVHCEPHASLTGFQADDRFAIRPGSEPVVLAVILRYYLNHKSANLKSDAEILRFVPNWSAEEAAERCGIPSEKLILLADEFTRAEHPLLIVGGVSLSHANGLETAVLAGVLQWVANMIGSVVDFSQAENYAGVGSALELAQFVQRLANGKVGVLFLSGLNPGSKLVVFSDIIKVVEKAKTRIGLYNWHSEMSQICDVILPTHHPLESWGDTQPRKNLITLLQPSVEPLYDSRSEGDVLLDLMESELSYQKYLFNSWRAEKGDVKTREFLARGFYQDESTTQIKFDRNAAVAFMREAQFENRLSNPVLIVTPSIRTFDGRSSNLHLLQEIPDPLTTISYGNWVSISKNLAEKLNVSDSDEVRISQADWSIIIPVKIQANLQDDVLTTYVDSVESLPLQWDENSGELMWYVDGIQITKTEKANVLPIMSGSMSQKGRGIIPYPVHNGEHHEKYTLYPPHQHPNYRWAMAIDLDKCTGCSACVAACYVENSVAIVGKKEHLIGREMSWLRIEPYFDEEGRAYFIPMMCQQCDNAPCEPVCPVYATYHNPEGLNAQIYNRCVGTRYCANNCPYKVRRFNWFDHRPQAPLDRMHNPDISVRKRGVMEKCTFCVQRIRAARDLAKDENRDIKDGEVVPSCAQTCPTGAIVFGNIKDENSEIFKLAHSDRAYRIFEHLGTEPSVYYLGENSEKLHS